MASSTLAFGATPRGASRYVGEGRTRVAAASVVLPLGVLATLLYVFVVLLGRFRAAFAADTDVVLALPHTLDELRVFGAAVARVQATQPSLVLALFSVTLLLKQALCVPGSALLNCLAGFVYGVRVAWPLVCVLNALGSALCYALSFALLARVVRGRLLAPLERLRAAVFGGGSDRRSVLLSLLTLRAFPMTPHWLVNLLSPFLVPFAPFFVACLVGTVPYNYVTVQSGALARELSTSDAPIVSAANLAKLLGIFVLVAVPTVLDRWHKQRTAATTTTTTTSEATSPPKAEMPS